MSALLLRVANTSCHYFQNRILTPSIILQNHYQYYCAAKSADDKHKVDSQKSKLGKYSRVAVRKEINKYVFSRFINYVKNYDKVLEKNFPAAVHLYRLFFEGVKDFLNDMKRYLKITRIVHGSAIGLRALTRKELELYLQMPKDMIKVAPTLVITALPFVGSAAFPIAYMFPRVFLSSHFWTIQQKLEFQQITLKTRFTNNRKVFRSLQAKLSDIKDDPYCLFWEQILGLLGSGRHPTVEDILVVKNIFTRPPYNFKSLSSSHIKNLQLIHNSSGGPFKRSKLLEHAFLIHHMDLAIQREGDVHNMPLDGLKHGCFLRGLNPLNMSTPDMVNWLRQWVKVSLAIQEEHISLFLHLPILLGYNHPNNWLVHH